MRTGRFSWSAALAVLLTALCSLSCSTQKVWRTQSTSIKEIERSSPYLKMYTQSGELYILKNWKFDSSTVITGQGVLLGMTRDTLQQGEFRVPASDITIYESNTLTSSTAGIGLGLVTIAHAALTVYCAINPKACFGSCPTFYVRDGTHQTLMAEGFSSSVLPSLEADDIDALYTVHPTSRNFELTMKNEALETHIVRSVDVLVVPHHTNCRVFKTAAGAFYEASQILPPTASIGPEGSNLEEIAQLDRRERRSVTDSNDLAKKETLDLTFDPKSDAQYGVVIGARQTFVSTYLFYQGMSYLGTHTAEWFAQVEHNNGKLRDKGDAFRSLLGGIEVWVQNLSGDWIKQGEAYEMGPIATDIHLVRIAGVGRPKHVQLRMSQGSWRIDWIALARLTGEVIPIVIHPSDRKKIATQTLLKEDGRHSMVRPSTDGAEALVTLPGDEYHYTYMLPEQPERYELFLKSRGYYMEWMREDWNKEEDLAEAAAMFMDPEGSLHKHAMKFKELEDIMEVEFWRSKLSEATQ